MNWTLAGKPVTGLLRNSLLALLVLLSGMASAALAAGDSFSGHTVTISDDGGGRIISYALKVIKISQDGDIVRFTGRCDSACTLHLAIARDHLCVSPGVAFGFHLPFGVSQQAAAMARDYMLNRYPAWVRDWIAANGGLTSQLKVMHYAYARKFIKGCDDRDFASAAN